MDNPRDKQEVIQRITDGRNRFIAILNDLSEKEINTPLEEGGWSIKDYVAHISIWEKRMVEWLAVVGRGDVPQQLPPGMTWDDLDRWNAQTYEADRERTLTDVLTEFDALGEESVRAVEAIPDDLLMREDALEWRSGSPLWEMVAENTFWHYPEHLETIKRYLDNR
jgi:hypothetical protein